MAERRKFRAWTPSGKCWATCDTVRLPKNQHERVYGLCDSEKKLILLDERLTPIERLSAIVHESVHLAAPDLVESAVERIEYTVLNLLRANPDILRPLREEE